MSVVRHARVENGIAIAVWKQDWTKFGGKGFINRGIRSEENGFVECCQRLRRPQDIGGKSRRNLLRQVPGVGIVQQIAAVMPELARG